MFCVHHCVSSIFICHCIIHIIGRKIITKGDRGFWLSIFQQKICAMSKTSKISLLIVQYVNCQWQPIFLCWYFLDEVQERREYLLKTKKRRSQTWCFSKHFWKYCLHIEQKHCPMYITFWKWNPVAIASDILY